jgi:hypothetical protein
VHVGRSSFREQLFARAVFVLVIGHHDRRRGRNPQARSIHAGFVEGAKLLQQHIGVHHHAIADDRERFGMQDA